jgi:hypothetical protein
VSVAPVKIRPSPLEILQRQMTSASFGGSGRGLGGLGEGKFWAAVGSADLVAHELKAVKTMKLAAIKINTR